MTRSNGIGIGAGIAVAAVAGLFVVRGNATAPLHGADVSVSCGPTQRAVVRQTVETGKPKVDIDCVTGAAGLQAATYVIDERGQMVPAFEPGVAPMAAPAIVPAVYQPRVSPGPADEAPVVRAPRRTTSATTAVRARRGRTWQQRALIIGGSAGAGAGVGALIGGKKGALIGAAAGGGGAALIDALRNR
jgi:hypothetical protein